MGEIKSAAEIAREKIARLGEVTEEEKLKWKYLPEGEKLAARYLNKEFNLGTEIDKFDDKARPLVVGSVMDILLRNIGLPRKESSRKTNKRAMEGIKAIKTDKVAVENVFSKIRHIIDHYGEQGEQQKKEAYESLKNEFEEKLQQAIRQRTGVNGRMNIDVEKQPQFLEEWQRLQARLEGQYLSLLDEYKQELKVIK
jgi:hypothetical protein